MGGVLNIGEFHYVILTFGRDAGGRGVMKKVEINERLLAVGLPAAICSTNDWLRI